MITHTTDLGETSRVDVFTEPLSKRVAVAEARIVLDASTLILIQDDQIKNGDVLATARIAGIQAAKQTALLIPLCHTLPLSRVSVDFSLRSDGITITTSATTISQTGVEMEALTAASIAALTIYDMCKAVDQTMRIEGLRLVSKTQEDVGA